MRISELSRRAEVPVATVKFYLREGLLPEGRRTSPTQAQYGPEHLDRLRLVRALLGPGGLSVATARDVLAAIESPPASVYDLLGVAAAAVGPPLTPGLDHPEVHALLDRWGWPTDDDCGTHVALAVALGGLEAAGFTLPPALLDRYQQHMTAIAQGEIDGIPVDSPAAAVRYVVLGTVLVEPVLLALRRLAQQELSRHRFGRDSPGAPDPRP